MQPTIRPAEQFDVRRGNLSVALRRLREAGPRSRARLAEETGLTKATVSVLVADLVQRGLLREVGPPENRGSGRPAVDYELHDRVYGIGAEVSVDYLSVTVLDLRGEVRARKRVGYDVPRAEREATLDALSQLVRETTSEVPGRPAGLTLAAPGNVNPGTGRVDYAPLIGWYDAPVAAPLADRLVDQLGDAALRVEVENDVKLAAIAEHALGAAAGTADLAYLSGEMGVGAGVIAAGRLVRGTRGHAGEIGHLPLNPAPAPCACGRTGCWETMVGLGALLSLAADPDDPVHDPQRDLEERLAVIVQRARAGDRRTLSTLEQVATGLGLGASVLINMMNPAVLVLGGYFAVLGDYLLDGVRREIADRVVAADADGCRVELSRLGFDAAALGGAYAALDRVFTDPTVVPI
ncbi:ROK family transcriptional regulator [Nocardioides speluncae]|uniref:ROK family transcriptional regulator n=1 Tax=Nocardioides speluncae TaxID=2670337 RepID=UPI001F0C5826|nr:ROK family transcriptional regulator [Nocardioides speluncae]